MAENKRAENASKWNKEHCVQFTMKIRNDSGLYDVLEKAIADSGKSRLAFCLQAITEKLIRDGYLPSDYGLSEKERLIRDGYLPKEDK